MTSKYTKEEILKKIDSFPFWYHRIELGNNITTKGWAPLCPEAYQIPKDLTNKRVLDIGAWDGYWTFEALRRGAKEVVAIDDFSDYLGSLEKKDRKEWETFDFCKEVLGYTDERCKRYNMDVMDVERLGEFDIIFFFGTFYHLRHPFYVLEKLGKICKEEIYIESAICDDKAIYSRCGYPRDSLILEFYPTKEYGKNATNWFNPTLSCLCWMAKACGFKEAYGWKLSNVPRSLNVCRGFVRASKQDITPPTTPSKLTKSKKKREKRKKKIIS